ncbi:zf-HC2 domain-containing protein [candidate division KSB1 bacterium]|nr:zf-HC2 domain-containing protein [candidate division KSB1 bacterium]
MRHHNIRKHLSAYAHQECSKDEHNIIENHIKTCIKCALTVNEYQQVANFSKQIPERSIPSEFIDQLKRDTLKNIEISKQKHYPPFRRLAFAGIFLLLIGTVTLHIVNPKTPVEYISSSDTLKLDEMEHLASILCNKENLIAIIDQPIPIHSLIVTLKQMKKLNQRHGQVNNMFERIMHQINGNVLQEFPTPLSSCKIGGKFDESGLTQMITCLRSYQRYNDTITFRYIASYYQKIRS